ncbi:MULTISPECIES: Crp/Fnr family transcriptional regulator [Chryseobacterium]|uniref:Crp/Fnr family transcriptional regulator n=1 Tax=Chryseobacterium pennae TaxID=2258962 RepID=A0A3D9C6S5_9FLAO|nr:MULTISPECIES: Crp/Fnr family transcriptional regulator [Chryseobacterium]MCS4304768.1 CRP-like cAMP-binding protein [Chryseobacterium sp. BIGb0232]REC61575.1 Crp/Fnr family transcriptional regulator [Chryseobacterium pennae]ROS20575.1 CRP-like cAMP-binding protein [Chryseobacterium nakagawai]
MSHFLKEHIQKIINPTNDEFEAIQSFFMKKRFRKRQFLIQEHQPVHEIFLIEKGIVKSSFIDTAGKEHILQFAASNWWISDFAGFFKQETSSLAVDCIEDAEVYAISYEDLNTLCAKVPAMEHFFRVKSNFGYVALQQRILSLMSKPAKERYEDFIKQYPGFIDHIPKQLIASYLGVSRETLSRLYL